MNLIAYGTRPEWIKVKTLIDIHRRNNYPLRVLYTGQQKDIGEFEYDVAIDIPVENTNRLNSVIAAIVKSDVFQDVQPIDTTVSNTLDITVEWGQAKTQDQIYSANFVLHKVY